MLDLAWTAFRPANRPLNYISPQIPGEMMIIDLLAFIATCQCFISRTEYSVDRFRLETQCSVSLPRLIPRLNSQCTILERLEDTGSGWDCFRVLETRVRPMEFSGSNSGSSKTDTDRKSKEDSTRHGVIEEIRITGS